jgi:hypothetical protein
MNPFKGEIARKNQKGGPQMSSPLELVVGLAGSNLSKRTLHPARVRSGWQCEKRKFEVNQFTRNCLEKFSARFQ